MPSVRAIASRLKVSPATVSRVLNNHPDVDEATRERVLAYINEIGYIPRVGRRITNVIALAYPDEPVRSEYGALRLALSWIERDLLMAMPADASLRGAGKPWAAVVRVQGDGLVISTDRTKNLRLARAR